MNPAVIMNSSVWGQFESVMTLLLLASLYFLMEGEKVPAALLFVLAVLTKPQSIMLAPVVAVMFFHRCNLRQFGLAVIGSIALYVAVVLPFSAGRPIYWVVEHYLKSGGDYPYATANGFNFWTIMGGQTVPDNQPFLGSSYAVWSLVLLVAVASSGIVYLWRNRMSSFAASFGAFFLCLGVFTVGSRMHERYLFPALVFLTLCCLADRWLAVPLSMLSLAHFGNTFYIYLRGWLEKPQVNPVLAAVRQWIAGLNHQPVSIWAPPQDPIGLICAWIALAILLYSFWYLYKLN